jgi:hypothetical protein
MHSSSLLVVVNSPSDSPRQRHVRCDEAKPGCQRCVKFQGICGGYGDHKQLDIAVSVPSMLLAKQLSGVAADPFDTLPVNMRLKSHELFHYCELFSTNAIFTPRIYLRDGNL